MSTIKSIGIAVFVFLCLDGIWLGWIAKQLYINEMGSLLNLKNGNIDPNIFAAILVYIVLILGIFAFVIPKAHGNPISALGWGALFGLVCYGTYDFTNLAVLSKWPVWLSVIDVIWGCFICGVTSSVVTYFK